MSSLRDIRRHIRSVRNTAQVTKAMEMIASAKMRKAQQAAINGRPYAFFLNRMLVSVRDHVDNVLHPFLQRRETGRALVILLSTDRGLCGGLNSNLFREVAKCDRTTTDFVSVGRKGTQFLMRAGYTIMAEFPIKEAPTALDMRSMSKFAREHFLNSDCRSVSVVFPRFINTLSQKPQLIPLLPITSLSEAGVDIRDVKEERDTRDTRDTAAETAVSDASGGELLIEPHPRAVLDTLLPFYIDFLVYQFTLATRASEHSARMVAMKSATDSANKLIKDLTLSYNKQRQNSITTEILEIATAQLAMNE